MATRRRRGSRISEILQHPYSLDGDPQGMDGQSPHNNLPLSMESSPLKHAHSIHSSQQKTPARSYYQRSYHSQHGPIDIFQNEIQGVREDTAELASWALSDKASFASGSFPTQHVLSQTAASKPSKNRTKPDELESLKQSESEDLVRPNAIPEVSEPASPSSVHSHKPPGVSALAHMFKSSPQTEEAITDDDIVTKASDAEEDGNFTMVQDGFISQPTEQTPLLLKQHVQDSGSSSNNGDHQDLESQKKINERDCSQAQSHDWFHGLVGRSRWAAFKVLHPKAWDGRGFHRQVLLKPVGFIPPVVLGLLLNILDALSYGMILFPLGQPVFADLGVDGISMFYVSCIVSQLVYSLGGSIFKGGIGSEMIEVVPFFHKMAFLVLARVGDSNPKAVIATTILSYSLSSIVTGAVFFLMGKCKLGGMVGFFPRHILIGCIGGVGWFLVATSLEICAHLDGNLEYNLTTLRKLFEPGTVALWVVPLFLALFLFFIKRFIEHSLLDAGYFLSIIGIFYFFVGALDKLELPDLRSKGWVFEAPEAGVPFYHFYTLYDFGAVHWAALAETIPTMFALTFFGIIHVPINVPALGITMEEDNVDIDRELKAHGLSNALSGFCGSIQNYLVYTNSVLFVRSGGNSRVAGVMLAMATFGVLVSGPIIIGYIPIMVVGALIFFLGFDLMREALVDTWGKVHRLEYATILIIVVTMGAWDFVVGILVGILLACVSFVLQTSRVSAIRNSLPGSIAASTVRRHPIQNRFLQDAGKQIHVMKLAGHLFFGTIVGVEKQIRTLLMNEFEREPIRFLILDLQNVVGVDFSAAEAFTRIKRILTGKSITLIVCGISVNGEMGIALCSVGLFEEAGIVRYFETLNSALEHCENDLLVALYQRRGASGDAESIPKQDRPTLSSEIMYSSPRRNQLQQVATKAFSEQRPTPQAHWQRYDQPLQLLLQTFSTVSSKPEVFWYEAVSFFERKAFRAGQVLYERDDMADGFFLLESGILKAEYMLPLLGRFSELIVEGTTCGELPFFSGTRRTSTTSAERDCVTWKLDQAKWEDLQKGQPLIAQELLKISLRLTSERMDAITKLGKRIAFIGRGRF
ncbi:MAG: hypothetical protein Q9174_000245 [Haloplaca sp. 1 TL-2023]